MCANCGCQGGVNQDKPRTTVLNLQTGAMTAIAPAGEHDSDASGSHTHVHADGTRHSPAHDHFAPHHHGGDEQDRVHDHIQSGQGPHHHAHIHRHGDSHDHKEGPVNDIVSIETRILAKNDALAANNRAWLTGRKILALNLVSSPGSGKTTLLERTIASLASELSLFVIEGDQATANDGERIRAAGAPVVQVNTGTGCHLDAEMVARGLSELRPGLGAVVLIENVGNLVCPALFDLGERAKTVIFSTTEGEDKPLKYPHMFRAATLVILNKIDLLPYLDFSVPRAIANVRRVNPDVAMLGISARTGEGLEDWYAWIRSQVVAARQFAFG
jgi:hydrogenase nickel incorporation protein HypB